MAKVIFLIYTVETQGQEGSISSLLCKNENDWVNFGFCNSGSKTS